MSEHVVGDHAPRVLFVCTANRCRSPMAAYLFAAAAHQAGIDVRIGSAGMLTGGGAMPIEGIRVMARRGMDLRGHRSSQIDQQTLADADVVLTMTRQHVRNLLAVSPSVWPRTFTLHEFVERAETADIGSDGFDEWVAELAAGRQLTDLVRRRPDGDIDDPIGHPTAVWEVVANEIDVLAGRLARAIGSRQREGA